MSMTVRILRFAWRKTLSLKDDQDGAALMITLAVFLFLFITVLSVYAVGDSVYRKIRLQNAADAAAYSAAVVQADGLSRMATVNRAMSWTYVQMTRRQMDYITYRWLRLTYERFCEDSVNAANFYSQISFTTVDPYPIPTYVRTASRRFGWPKCKSHTPANGWWCGLGVDRRDTLLLNGREISLADLQAIITPMMVYDDNGGMLATSAPAPGNGGGDDTYDPDETAENLNEDLKEYYRQSGASSQWGSYESWLAQYGCVDNADGTAAEAALEKVVTAFTTYTGTAYEPTGEFYEKFYAWYQSLSPEQRVYLVTGVGGASVSAGIPTTYPAPSTSSSSSSMAATAGTNPPQSVAATGAAAGWGAQLGRLIDYDKSNLSMLNLALSAINANMYSSMQAAAKIMLQKNLWLYDRNATAEDYRYSITCPLAMDPYDLNSSQTAATFFSALPNTEAGERVFLEMGRDRKNWDTPHTTLADYFKCEIEDRNGSRSWDIRQDSDGKYQTGGLDQWMIRGGAQYALTGATDQDLIAATPLSTYRVMPGNVTGRQNVGSEGDFGIMRVYKDANLNETGEGFIGGLHRVDRGNHLFSWPGKMPAIQLAATGISAVDSLINQVVDSVFNQVFSQFDQFLDVNPSCVNSYDEDAVPAMCQTVAESVALYSQYRWASSKWLCRYRIKWTGAKFRQHIGFPKWFCGKPHELSIIPAIGQYLPPLDRQDTDGPSHGYLEHTWDASGMFEQFRQLLPGSVFSRSREDYRSCAVVPSNESGFLFVGHARIYGDDREIWDQRYAGFPARPWILNEKYFNGQGSIIIGVAEKQTNPLAWLLGRAEKGWGSVFRQPTELGEESNYFTAMSAARAGVRYPHTVDVREYAQYFDDSAETDQLTWRNPSAAADLGIGCVCVPENADKLARQWNLCTPDWDATLIPLRYARSASRNGRWENAGGTAQNPFLNTAWQRLSDDGRPALGIPQNRVNRNGAMEVSNRDLLFQWRVY